jgi:hypothetical protein
MMVSVAQDNLASNGRMMVNNELEKMWKEVAVA